MKQLILSIIILFFLCSCDKDSIPPLEPTITTGGVVSSITNTTATVSLTITNVSNSKEVGVFYSTSLIGLSSANAQKWSAENIKSGDNSVSLTGLMPGTTYYYKAYATDGYFSICGDMKTFTTGIDYPTLTANNVSSITSTQVTCCGNISSSGGGTINARGVCWSTSSSPTVSLATKTVDGTGTGSFSSTITGLLPKTTYYVRAYATNEKGTAYGAQFSFTTLSIKEVDSQTINGYTLTQDESWSGTILLKGDIVVPSGLTLTINPGTIISVSTDAPLYDGGAWTGKIDFTISGNIIINGTAQNIVQLKSAATSSTSSDWYGIMMRGNRLEISYCLISDSFHGVYCMSSSTVMKINNCLFNNIITAAIIDLGSLQHTLSYNSFINVGTGYDMWNSNRFIQLDYSEFKNNRYDITFSGITDYLTKNSSVTVNYSNFSGNTGYNLYWGDYGGSVTNSNITANHCYGITTKYQTNGNGNGNTYTYTNQLSSPYSGAGCGFSSMAKSPSLRSSIISSNPEQQKRTLQEHNERIMQQYAKMKRQRTY